MAQQQERKPYYIEHLRKRSLEGGGVDEDGMYVRVDVPGVRNDGLTLKVEGKSLIFNAASSRDERTRDRKFCYSGYVTVDIDCKSFYHTLENGCLNLFFPGSSRAIIGFFSPEARAVSTVSGSGPSISQIIRDEFPHPASVRSVRRKDIAMEVGVEINLWLLSAEEDAKSAPVSILLPHMQFNNDHLETDYDPFVGNNDHVEAVTAGHTNI